MHSSRNEEITNFDIYFSRAKFYSSSRLHRIIPILLFLISSTNLVGQVNFTLCGKVSDSATGEDMIGASVMITDKRKGCITNSYGFYSMSLPAGEYTLRLSYLGYKDKDWFINLEKDTTLNIEITPVTLALDEVVISSRKNNRNITGGAGIEKIYPGEIEKLPVFFGEKDLLKTIQLLPGISSPSEGSTGFNVRGGSVGQNLILLDEAPVYGSSHLMGFFSVFNSDVIKDVTVYKGGIPAKYGGRASSVLDISMNNGNSKNFGINGGVGLVSSRLAVEFPVIKDKMSFMISGRRTYGDLVAKLLFPGNLVSDDLQFFFYDLNAKLNYTLNSGNRFFISGYIGKDVFELNDRIGTHWGNATSTIRWNHIYNNRLFSNTSLIFSNYNYGFLYGQEQLKLQSGIRDFSFKQDFTCYINPDLTFQSGLNVIYHIFLPGEFNIDNSSNYKVALNQKQGFEGAIYLQNEHKFSDRLSLNYGLRISSFFQVGPVWLYKYEENNQPVDSVFYNRGRIAAPYIIPEPRISLSYLLNETHSLKISYSRMAQYLHLLTNTTAGSPVDIWLPVSNNFKPLIASQVSAGYFRNFIGNKFETSAEVYYKKMTNTYDYEDGADIIFEKHIESQILIGNGRSYGMEFYLKKKYGKLTGWISYTVARSENKVEEINNNNWYPVRYDRVHDLSVVSLLKLGKRVSLSGLWVFASGNAVTFPSGRYTINNIPVPFYTERNGYRMPGYHRLDLSLTISNKNLKRYKSQLDFSVYNVYNRYNAYIISFRESETNPGEGEAVKLSLFGIVPSVSYNFRF